jgi:hypothetical protein
MKRFYVRNKLSNDVVERKPLVGEFTIPAGKRVEFPRDVAEALVNDYGRPGLELEVEKVPDIPKAEP